MRKFKSDVRKLTESEFGIALAPSEEIDAAAAKLYDGIILWAKALSRVFANNGAPPCTIGVGCEACGSGATHSEASESESAECQSDQLAVRVLPSGNRRDGKAIVAAMGGISFPSEPRAPNERSAPVDRRKGD